jgi:hypothetical protein
MHRAASQPCHPDGGRSGTFIACSPEIRARRAASDLAKREGVAPSSMTRVMRMTLLAPEIVEAIVDGREGPEVTLAALLEPFPQQWSAQTSHFG